MNPKKKGNHGENLFSNWLQSHGIKAYRNSSSGANEFKSDVHNNINYNFEVKTVKKINLQKAWNQTNKDSSMSHTIPSLAIHFDNMPQNTWLMVISSEDWIELIKKKDNIPLESPKIPIEVPDYIELGRSDRWIIKSVIDACKRLLKIIDKNG